MVVRSSGSAKTLKTVLGTLVFSLLGCGVPASQNVTSASSTLVNPLLGNTVAIAAGCQLYGAHCAHCHGERGSGNGEHGVGLTPPPANLVNADALAKPDGHLFQRVWFGGQAPPYNSSMPPFNEVITHEQVWQTLAYIRALAAGSAAACVGAEANHEHSHSPNLAAGTGASLPAAGGMFAPSTAAASGGIGGVADLMNAMSRSAGSGGAHSLMNPAAGHTAGFAGASSSMNIAGQSGAGSLAEHSDAGATSHAGEGAAGAHEH